MTQPLGPVSTGMWEHIKACLEDHVVASLNACQLRASEQAALLENAQLKDANTMLHAELEKLGDNAVRRLKHLQGENEVLRRKRKGHRAHIRRMQDAMDRQGRELSMRYRHVSELTHERNVETAKRQAAEAEVERLKAEATERAMQYLSDQGQWIEETGRLRAVLEYVAKWEDGDYPEAVAVAREALHGR